MPMRDFFQAIALLVALLAAAVIAWVFPWPIGAITTTLLVVLIFFLIWALSAVRIPPGGPK